MPCSGVQYISERRVQHVFVFVSVFVFVGDSSDVQCLSERRVQNVFVFVSVIVFVSDFNAMQCISERRGFTVGQLSIRV